MALEYKSSLARYRRYIQIAKEKPLWSASFWVILTLVLLIVMVFAALKPTLTKIASLVGQIKQRQEISQKLDEKILKMKDIQKMLEENRDNIVLLDEGLPQSPEWKDLALKLQDIASQSAENLTTFTYGLVPVTGKGLPAKKTDELVLPGGISYIRLTMMGTGEYGQMKQLISESEKIRRILIVDSFRIAKDKDGNLINTVEAIAPYFPEGSSL
jgi:Tfp pilus assembly protein PilO